MPLSRVSAISYWLPLNEVASKINFKSLFDEKD
jgi:hypothetical protein